MTSRRSWTFFRIDIGLILAMEVLISSCQTTGNCRAQENQALASELKAKQAEWGTGGVAGERESKSTRKSGEPRVMIFKNDGSVQCSRLPGQTPEQMASQLHGITIFS